ncbi:MAG: hypothetical protein KBT31_03800 [Firmicutes bacterium]|nr:hypothetical protein [Candidatus Colimorpha enterica]
MKDEKKVKETEEKKKEIKEEQLKNVAGGDGNTRTCPHCGQEINIVLYMEHIADCHTSTFSSQRDITF